MRYFVKAMFLCCLFFQVVVVILSFRCCMLGLSIYWTKIQFTCQITNSEQRSFRHLFGKLFQSIVAAFCSYFCVYVHTKIKYIQTYFSTLTIETTSKRKCSNNGLKTFSFYPFKYCWIRRKQLLESEVCDTLRLVWQL